MHPNLLSTNVRLSNFRRIHVMKVSSENNDRYNRHFIISDYLTQTAISTDSPVKEEKR